MAQSCCVYFVLRYVISVECQDSCTSGLWAQAFNRNDFPKTISVECQDSCTSGLTTDSICELIFVKKWFPSFVCVQCLFVSSKLVYTIWSSSSRSPRHQRPVSTQKDVYWDGSMAPTISESVVTRELSCANYVFQKYDLTTIWGRPLWLWLKWVWLQVSILVAIASRNMLAAGDDFTESRNVP
jgi:hypothetical protein